MGWLERMDERNQRAVERDVERQRRRASKPSPRWLRWVRRAMGVFAWARVFWSVLLWIAGITALVDHLWAAAAANLLMAAVFTAFVGLHLPWLRRRT